MKHYVETNLEGSTHLKLEVYYDKGGPNYFNGGTDPRGYWLSVTPVNREGNWETMVIGRGTRKFLLEVKRQSPKALAQAEALATPELQQELIAHVESRGKKRSALNEISKKLGVGLPEYFRDYTEEQIRNLPVQVIDGKTNRVYPNIAAAYAAGVELQKLCGAMRGSDNGSDCLRFETQEMYNILSN